jgi:uncharacterized protein involved in outer membrane biogenesis
VLNRLYIVVGVLAILLLAAAFIVPLFVPWNDYRAEVEALASELAGEPVGIAGNIGFTLLPQPQLRAGGISVGPPGAPVATAGQIEADFSLIDFLRNRYVITRLVIDKPVIDLGFDGDGRLLPAVGRLPGERPSEVSIADAEITGGMVRLSDRRSGKAMVVDHVEGSVKLEAVGGPFSFQGTGRYEGRQYAARITSSALAEDGAATVAVAIHPADDAFAATAQGSLTLGEVPSFAGELSFRQPPPPAPEGEPADVGQGDFVLTGKLEATPAHLLIPEYLAIPDENRPATRLTGAAEIALGSNPAFNAVISGGVLAQPPRDATAEPAAQPYELVRLLRELPAPPLPGIPGTVGIDISEIDLRAMTLHDVRADAAVGPDGWTVSRLTAGLAGDTSLTMSGSLRAVNGHAEFAGKLALTARRLDALAALWRKPSRDNPLIGKSGALEATLALVGQTLSVDSGRLTIKGGSRSFSAQIGFGGTRDLHFSADLGELDAAGSATLLALLPDPAADAGFAASFPTGQFDVVGDSMVIAGLSGRALAAHGSWDGGVLVVDEVSAGDLGGAKFKANLTAFGSFDKPEVSGEGTLTVASASAPALAAFYGAIDAPPGVVDRLAASFPADLAVRLEAPSGDGAQSLSVSGTAGPSQLQADARLDAGFVHALDGHFRVRLDLKAADPDAMTAQLGLGTTAVVGATGPLHLVGLAEGALGDSLETTMLLEGGGDSVGFSGNLIVTDPTAMTGKGTLKASLDDPAPLLAFLGAEGLSPPGFSATSGIEFSQGKWVRLDDIAGESGGEPFTGTLAVSLSSPAPAVTGMIAAGRTDLDGMLRLVAGPAALLSSAGAIWPDGPIDMGTARRGMTGRVHFTSPALTEGGTNLVTDLSADLDWDATGTRIRSFSGAIGGGEAALDLQVCCAGPLSAKQVSGRLSLTGVELKALLPSSATGALGGSVNAIAQFAGTGDSPRAMISALTGEGTYSVRNFSVEGLDPGAVTAVVGLENVLDMQPADLTRVAVQKLGQGPFTSPGFSGSVSIAGGTIRSPNVSIAGDGGRLFGTGSLALADLTLGGDYALTPTNLAESAPIDAASAKITAQLSGTLGAPEHSFDVSGLVDAIMVEAYQREVTRLEKLKAEDDARRKAAAEEAARQAAAQKAADESAAAKKAAEEAAAKKAADDAAAQKAADDAAAKRAMEQLNQPLDLGLDSGAQ